MYTPPVLPAPAELPPREVWALTPMPMLASALAAKAGEDPTPVTPNPAPVAAATGLADEARAPDMGPWTIPGVPGRERERRVDIPVPPPTPPIPPPAIMVKDGDATLTGTLWISSFMP